MGKKCIPVEAAVRHTLWVTQHKAFLLEQAAHEIA